MRHAVLDFMSKRGPFVTYFEDWSTLVSSAGITSQVICKTCGDCIFSRRFEMRDTRMPSRRQSRSMRCNMIEDVDVSCNLCLMVQGNFVEVHGNWGNLPWLAILRFVARDMDDLLRITWPRDAKGKPLRRVAIPDALPPGPLTASVFIMEGANFDVLSAPFRAESGWRSACSTQSSS